MSAPAPTILVVDDDPGVLDVVAFTLRREGFEVDEERDGAAALDAARARTPSSARRASTAWQPGNATANSSPP